MSPVSTMLSSIHPAVGTVELPGGVLVPFAEQGDGGGVPVVLLHGRAGSWRSFASVLQHLPASVHAFAPTQRGRADSGDLARDVVRFLDRAGLDAVILCGHASGADVAARVVRDHPHRVRA